MPKTPFPDFKGCSASQEAFLKEAWRAAHHATWRVEQGARPHHGRQRDASAPSSGAATTWPGSEESTSPRTWFGSYDRQRAEQVRDALGKARARFEMRGQVVKGIGTVRCGRPIAPAKDENVDVCPGSNPGIQRAAERVPLSHRHGGDLRTILGSREQRQRTRGARSRRCGPSCTRSSTGSRWTGSTSPTTTGTASRASRTRSTYGPDKAMYLAETQAVVGRIQQRQLRVLRTQCRRLRADLHRALRPEGGLRHRRVSMST